jgi:hypothetical protein
MRKLTRLFAVAFVVTGFSVAFANVDDEKTVTGDAMCAKCALKEKPSCQNVVIAKEDGKEVKYYLVQNAVAKKAHQADGICQASKDAPVKLKVTGTVVEKDGKMEMTATKIEKAE